jgi:phage-related protein
MADGSIRVGTSIDLSGLKKGLKEMEKDLAKAEKEYADLEKQFESRSKDYQKRIDRGGTDGTKAEAEQLAYADKMGKQMDVAYEKIQKYKLALAEATSYYERMAGLAEASNQLDRAMADDKFISGITTQEKYNSLLSQNRSEMARMEAHAARIAAQTGKSASDILRANEAYQKASHTARLLETRSKDINTNIRRSATNLKEVNKQTRAVGDATRRGIAGFGKMQLAMMGIMFAMRAISAATQEYMAVNTQLEGQINTLRALWGQVLGPVIEWVINLLIQAISAVNAFVYALSGINFVARANEAALKKQAKAAGGGSGNSTASFDEQTKLTQTGGGGSGNAVATLPDGTQMDMSFLDPLKDAIKRFANDISPFLSTVKELGTWLLENFLIPLGDWALNGVIPGFLNILGAAFLVLNDALWKIQPVALWIWDNFLEPIASWTGGVIVDVLNAIGDWIRDHQDTLSTLVAIAGGLYAALSVIPTVISLVSAAFGVLVSALTSPITWLTALIVLFVTLYDECEGFRKGMNEAWEGIKGVFQGAVDFIKALFKGDWAGMDEAWKKIQTSGKELFKGLYEGLKAGWNWAKEKVLAMWEKVKTSFCNFFGIKSPSTLFRDFGKFMIDGLVNGISGAISRVITACRNILSGIKEVFQNIPEWFRSKFSDAWTAVKNVFSTGGKIFDGIKEGIVSTFKTIVNGIISGINKVIATPFNSINSILNKIRSISVMGIQPFSGLWGYSPLSVPQIPKLARGGIVNRPGRGVPAIIGEAGREAVLPLDNHTEWMDILADKIGGGTVTIPIYLDGKKIYTYMVDIGKRRAFAANGG